MLKMSSKALARAICLAIASVGFVASAYAADTNVAADENALDTYHLAEVVVHGQRYIAGEFVRATSNIGILGERDMMNTPLSVTTISEKAVGNFMNSTEGLSASLSLVPSIRKASDNAVDQVTIRGFSDSGRGFSINGIPGMQAMTRQSSNYIDSVDVIEGPTVGITGSSVYATAGGTININSKKALEDEDTRKVGIKYHSKGAHEEYVDIGQRFGEDNRYGARVIVTNTDGERAVSGWDLEQRSIYLNLDQRTDESKTNFMVGYTYTDSQGRPYGFSTGSYVGATLLGAPDGDTQLNPRWRRDKNTNFVMTLNHEQKINDNLSAFLNLGHFKQDWYHYTGFSKSLLNEAGDFKVTSDNYSLIEKRDYAQIGLKGDFKTGELTHNYVLGVDRTWHYYGAGVDYKEVAYSHFGFLGNIYNSNVASWPSPSELDPNFSQTDARYNTKARLTGWSVSDTITTANEKLNVFVGVSGKNIRKDSLKSDGSYRTDRAPVDSTKISPSYGINYAFSPRLAVFASHTEQFVDGNFITSNLMNKGQALDPYEVKANEIGLKAKTGDFFHKLSYFDIKKANYNDVRFPGDPLDTRVIDGEVRHKGLEYTATGTIAEKWNAIGGVMYLDTRQVTNKAATNGKRANGVPEWTANFGLEYKASDTFSALARANYVGSSYIQNEKYSVPSYFTFDLGVKAKTKFNDLPVTLSAMCYNVADKNYWNPEGNTLHVGGPRTFMLSAEFEL